MVKYCYYCFYLLYLLLCIALSGIYNAIYSITKFTGIQLDEQSKLISTKKTNKLLFLFLSHN